MVNHFITDAVDYPKRYEDYDATHFQVSSQCGKLSGVLTDPDYEAIAKRVWNFVLKHPGRYNYPNT